MDLNQKKIDIDFGQFILKQYKTRKKLGLLFQKNCSNADLICSKYQEKYLLNEVSAIELEEENDRNLFKEFERVLQELQRREELIHELLAKIENYESTPKESRSICTNSLPKHTKTYSEFVQTSETKKPENTYIHSNEKGKCLLLWKSILSEIINSKYVKYSECLNYTKDCGLNKKCKHEQLINLYKNELSILYEEVEKLKMGSGLH